MRLSGKVAINVSALTAGRLLNSLTGVVAVAIAARYLHVESYGALIAGIAFTGIIGSLTDLGTATIGAREIAKRPNERNRLLRAVFTVNTILCVFAILVGLIAMFLLYPGQANELEREAILLLMLPTLILPPASTVGVYFITEQKNYLGMIASVGGSLALLALVVATQAFGWGFTGIAGAYAANGAVFSLIMVGQGLSRGIPLKPSLDRALVVQIMRWALPLGGSLVITALYWRLDVVLLSVLAGSAEVGPYGLAFKIVDVLGQPADVHDAHAAARVRAAGRAPPATRGDHAEGVLGHADRGRAAAGVHGRVRPQVIETVGGDDFADAVPILQVLMLGVVISYMAAVCAQGLIALNRQKLLLWLSLIGLAANGALNAALIPLFGGIGAAWAYAATELVAISLLVWQFTKFARFPRPTFVGRFAVAAAATAAVGLIKLLPGVDSLPAIVVLAIGGILSGVVYLGALYALRAVPPVVDEALLRPIWNKLRRAASTAASASEAWHPQSIGPTLTRWKLLSRRPPSSSSASSSSPTGPRASTGHWPNSWWNKGSPALPSP